ncbi:MAG: chemotaxis protein CheW [Verrucomicrobiae bacterium]|nr:chemotaxis protein CheW [Verrucomicrobiae bacterium]
MSEQQSATVPASPQKALAGKYLTFLLGKESYGIGVLRVREIIRMQETTSIPQLPPFVKGVINLRGKVIPVIDLRVKFNLPQVEVTERTCIVVVQVNMGGGKSAWMGLVVDAVEEVAQIGQGEIEDTPDFGMKLSTNYILGMAKIKGVVKTLLDIDQVVAAETIELISQALPA